MTFWRQYGLLLIGTFIKLYCSKLQKDGWCCINNRKWSEYLTTSLCGNFLVLEAFACMTASILNYWWTQTLPTTTRFPKRWRDENATRFLSCDLRFGVEFTRLLVIRVTGCRQKNYHWPSSPANLKGDVELMISPFQGSYLWMEMSNSLPAWEQRHVCLIKFLKWSRQRSANANEEQSFYADVTAEETLNCWLPVRSCIANKI